MSLRSKVFFLFGALLAILLGSQWLMMRSITQDVSRELGQVAFSVARDTTSYFILGDFNWDQHLFQRAGANNISKNIQVKSKVTLSGLNRSNSTTRIISNAFIYRPPAVEIRLNNQIEDNFLELITETGVQSIPIPRDKMIETVQRLESRMLSGSLIILVFGLLVAGYFSHHLSAPLRDLSEAAKSVSEGELGTTIDRKGKFISSEIKSTVESFNHMSRQLVEIEQLKNRVQENEHYKELGEIARGLAHSIRNPLNTLGLTIEELTENNIDITRKQKLLDSATRQINRVDHWIRSFMTFSLAGDTQSESVDLLAVIQDIQLEVSQSSDNKISFEVSTEKAEVNVEGVNAELRAILQALIVNAVEASPALGTISINLSESAKSINLIILDQGNGVPKEYMDKLFQPHQTTKARGSGMGLFIAHRLVTGRYSGQISLTNRKAGGTKVSLTLAKKRMV